VCVLRLRHTKTSSTLNMKCRQRSRYIVVLPFLALLMVAESIGRAQPHKIIATINKIFKFKDIDEIVVCYKLHVARFGDSLRAFEKTLEDLLGDVGKIIARNYIIAYNVRGSKIAAVTEFTKYAIDIFNQYIRGKLMLAKEVVKVVVIMIASVILSVSLAAFISINVTALTSIMLLAVIAALVLAIVVDIRIVVKWLHRKGSVVYQHLTYMLMIGLALLALFYGYSYIVLSLSMASFATALYINYYQLYLKSRELLDIKLLLREIGDIYAVTAKIAAPHEAINDPEKKLLVATLKGVDVESQHAARGPFYEAVRKVAARLIYGGTYRHVKVVEEILESLADTVKDIVRTIVQLDSMLLLVYIAAGLSGSIIVNMFKANMVAEQSGAQLFFQPNIPGGDMLSLLMLVNAVTVSITSMAVSYAIAGTFASPVPPLVLAVYTLYSLWQ